MAVNKKLKEFYLNFWEYPELLASNIIMTLQYKNVLRKKLNRSHHLTKAQKKQVRDYWKPYARISTNWARYNTFENGTFDPRYIPYTLYYTKIDSYLNNRRLGYGFNDKNYYSKIFSDIKQPDTVVRKINSFLFDENYNLIDVEKAMQLISMRSEVIVKPSQDSGSGRDIAFLKPVTDSEAIRSLLSSKKEKNYIIQAVVKQHESLKKVHENSLNTIRIVTLLMDDGVHILNSVLRMGANASRLDNASVGGLYVKINSDGTLDKYARSDAAGDKLHSKHPQGLVFEGYQIPHFDKVIETVKTAAQRIGNFRLVSWDMAIDEDGDVLLIEANMRKGGVSLHQFTNGPLFGDLTDRVLDEVFSK